MTARLIPRAALWVVAAFYAYGGLVHVLNMLSLTGFDWTRAPLKWQLLDVLYLALDLIVAFGLARQIRLSRYCFYAAALSQIILYSVLRDWIVDVPVEFAVSPEQLSYLDTLLIFHSVTLIIVSVSLYMLRDVTPPVP